MQTLNTDYRQTKVPRNANDQSMSRVGLPGNQITRSFTSHLHETTEARDYFLYIIMLQIHSLTDERFINIDWEYRDNYQRPLVEFRDKNKLSIYVPLL